MKYNRYHAAIGIFYGNMFNQFNLSCTLMKFFRDYIANTGKKLEEKLKI